MRTARFGQRTKWMFIGLAALMTGSFLVGWPARAGYSGDNWSAGIEFGSLFVIYGPLDLSTGWVFDGRCMSPLQWRGSPSVWLPVFDCDSRPLVAGVPLWIPAGAVLLPGVWLWLRGAPRRVRDRCPRCRYDLRGLPRKAGEALICPECGGTVGPRG